MRPECYSRAPDVRNNWVRRKREQAEVVSKRKNHFGVCKDVRTFLQTLKVNSKPAFNTQDIINLNRVFTTDHDSQARIEIEIEEWNRLIMERFNGLRDETNGVSLSANPMITNVIDQAKSILKEPKEPKEKGEKRESLPAWNEQVRIMQDMHNRRQWILDQKNSKDSSDTFDDGEERMKVRVVNGNVYIEYAQVDDPEIYKIIISKLRHAGRTHSTVLIEKVNIEDSSRARSYLTLDTQHPYYSVDEETLAMVGTAQDIIQRYQDYLSTSSVKTDKI